ncbi:MAG: hypothetical protein IJX28_09685, partial [Clostridia bacterium]|nr:hypothetical protein [Clostridia bacterium]
MRSMTGSCNDKRVVSEQAPKLARTRPKGGQRPRANTVRPYGVIDPLVLRVILSGEKHPGDVFRN